MHPMFFFSALFKKKNEKQEWNLPKKHLEPSFLFFFLLREIQEEAGLFILFFSSLNEEGIKQKKGE